MPKTSVCSTATAHASSEHADQKIAEAPRRWRDHRLFEAYLGDRSCPGFILFNGDLQTLCTRALRRRLSPSSPVPNLRPRDRRRSSARLAGPWSSRSSRVRGSAEAAGQPIVTAANAGIMLRRHGPAFSPRRDGCVIQGTRLDPALESWPATAGPMYDLSSPDGHLQSRRVYCAAGSSTLPPELSRARDGRSSNEF